MAKRRRSARGKRRLQRGFVLLTLLLVVIAVVVVAVPGHRVTRQFEGRRWTLPARVYAQPVELYVGQSLSAGRFAEELERLGYLAQARPDRPGTYQRRGPVIDVQVRAFRFPDEPQAARALRVAFAGDAISSLQDAKGTDVPVIRLDPLLIGSIFPIHDVAPAARHFPAATVEVDPSISGGMDLECEDGRIRVSNSLETRLATAWPDLLPGLIEAIASGSPGHATAA